nr:hypothetical protein [Tanacetum cinerariifolium]
MRTRSQSRNNFPQQEASPVIVEPLRIKLPFLEDQFQEDPPKDPPEVSMADNQTMVELLQAPTEDKMPRECLKIIESKSKVRQSRAKAVVAKTRKTNPQLQPNLLLLLQLKQLSQIMLLAVVLTRTKIFPLPTETFIKITSKRTFPSNTIINPKEELKGITTRNGVAYQGATIPTPFKVAKQGTEVTKDQVKTPSSQSTTPVQPLVAQSETQTLVFEPIVAPVSAPMPNLKPSIPYPSRRDNERRRDQANKQIEKFYEILKDMSFEISFRDALNLMPKFASTLNALIENKEKLSEMARTPINEHCSAVILNKLPRKLGDPGKFLIPCEFPGMDECLALADLGTDRALIDVHKGELTLPNKIDVIDLACEEYSQEVLGFSDVTTSGNPTPYDDPIVSTTSPTLTPFGDGDFLLFEEADAFLGLEDNPNSLKINPFYNDPKGDILLLEAILNSEPLPPLSNHEQYMHSFKKELKVYKEKTVKSSIDEPPEVELKDLPPHLEYAFLEGDNKLPVIIAKELGDEEKSALIKDYKPAIQHQRRVNPKIHDVIKKEVEKLLDAGLIYLISDSPWVSPVHYVPKKGGFTVVENEENELIPTRLVTGWRDFFKISRPMTHLLEKNTLFIFSKDCIKAFQMLNKKPTEASILIAPNWDLPFELMCDASDFAIGAVLGQYHEKHFRPIHYASKMMTDAESNYTTTKKEMLVVMYAFKKFRSYLIMNKSIVHTNHSALKYPFAKKDAKARLLRWVLLLQEFDFKVLDTKGADIC